MSKLIWMVLPLQGDGMLVQELKQREARESDVKKAYRNTPVSIGFLRDTARCR